MIEQILETLKIMGILGIVLAILVFVNIGCKTISNVQGGEPFSIKKFGKGILKALIFYIAAAAVAIAFTILPFVNEMITEAYGVALITEEMLESLSNVAILGVVISTIVVQGKNALDGIVSLAKMTTSEINDEGNDGLFLIEEENDEQKEEE